MNPTTDTHQRQRKGLDPNDNKKTHTMMGTNEEMKRPSSHRHRSYRLNSSHVKLSHLDPELVTSDSDSESDELKKAEELARKRTELQQIEKQIRLQKTTDAMKTTRPFLKAKKRSQMLKEERKEDLSHSKVESSVKNAQPFMTTLEKDVGVSSGEWSSTYNNRPLKETVNGILQQRWPDVVLATAKALSTPSDHLPSPNPVEKTHTSTLSEDDHPLKLRVKALMNRRCNSGSLDSHGEVPVVKAPPSCESHSTSVTENNLVVKGFQRFLSVLNNGVDIEMLTKMVNDDHERPPTGQELLHSQTRVVKEKSDVCKSESQQLQRGAGQRDRRSCSKERKTELLNQDLSNGGRKRNIQPEEKSSQGDDGGGRHSGSSRRSRSPPVVEEKKPKLVQHQEDLQNILKTIGFSLDADDMCKLEERTQERLYGIKHDTKQRLDSSGVSKRIQQHVQSDKSHSLSSTSISVSTISSPSCNQHSLSKTDMDSREQTQSSEYLHFKQGSREGGSERDVDKDKNRIASRDGSSGHHQYPENQEYLVTYPVAACAIPMYNSDAASAILSYTSVQHSENAAYHSDTSNCASLNYGSNDIPPSSSYPPGFCNYSMTPSCPSDTGALFDLNYPHSQPPAPCNTALGHSYFNTDLSLSEGQTGQRSGSHYLHIINTEKPRGAQIKVRQRGNNHNLSLGEAQTEQQPAIKVKFQREEKKMTKQKQGLREGQRSIQRQLLEVELLTEEEINANPTKKEQNPNLSLSEGQTGHQSDLCHLHSINTIQHSESTASHSDTSNSASLTAGSNVIPPSTSCPPGFCNSINPVWTSADTKAFLSKVCSQKQLPLIINPIKWFMKDLWFVRKSIASVKSDPVIMNNSKEQQKILEKLAEREQDILKRLARIGHKRSKMEIKRQMEMAKDKKAPQKQLDVVRNSTDGVNCDPLMNSEEKRNKLEKLAGVEQDILKKLGQNPDLSLSEGQTEQTSAVNTVTKAKFQKEEKKMAEQKEGQKESKISIQGQQLEVELPTEEIINANLTKKEQKPDLSLSEGQTGHQSDLCHLHSINTIQHSESTASHSDTSNSASLTAGSNVIPPSSSCPPGFCNSINPVWTSADTEAFLVKTCPQKKTSLRIHPREWFSNDLRFVRRTIARVKSDPVIMNNSEEHQKILENLAEREQDILKRLEQIPSKRQEKDLQRSLKFVRNSIDGVNCDPLINSEEKRNKLEKLAGAEQDILKKLGKNPDLSLSQGQTEQRSAVNTVTKAKFQREEKKMAEQKEGQKESKISIQGQQLEVELPTEEIINANLTKKEQNSDLSLSEGQTGHQSDLCHLHSINTIQHSESISSHSDTSNSASLTAGSNDIPPSSSCPSGFCNSINPVWTSADTEAFLVKTCPQKKTSLRIHPREWFSNDLRFVRRTIARVKSDPVIMNNSKEQQKILEKLAEREQDILKRLARIGHKRSKMEIKRQMEMAKDKKALQKQLDVVRNSIDGVNCDPLINSEEKQKKLEKLAGAEQDILKKLGQNPDLSLSEGQTGQRSAVNTVTKAKFQKEEKKMAEQKEGQKESKISIQGQQLEVELPTEEIINANLTKKEQNSDLSLSEGQTGHQSDLRHLHSINTIQHSESISSHSDTSNSASLTAGSNDIPPSSSCPSGFCNSINPVWTSADTEAFLVKICPQKKTSLRIHPREWFSNDLRFVRRTIARVKSDPVIMNNSEEHQKILENLAEREQDILKRLEQIPSKRQEKDLQRSLKFVRNSIDGVNCDPLINSEEKRNKLEKLAGAEQDILKKLGKNPDLSLSQGQTEQRSAVNTVTKAKFQREEKKMAEQKEGQKESKISIQGQQLEVELPTEEIINANLTKKEQKPDLSLSEGQTGHQSDLCHLHSINTIQHSESTASHSDTSNSASLTAGSNVIPPSSSCPPGFCNSINPVWTSADTEAFLGKVRSQKKDLTFVRKTIAHVKSDPVIMNNSKEQQKILEKLAEREQDILKRLASTGQKRSKMEIKRQMRKVKGKKALLKRLEQNPDLSLSERQTGHPSDPFHLHSGYTPPLRHVSFTTCLHYDTNPIFNPYPELNPYGSVATPTIRNQFRSGDMSEWRATPFHSINTIQHERHYCAQESTASHSDSRNSASLTAGSYDIPPSTSYPPGFCNSMNPVWTSADTEAFIVKFCSPKKTNNKKLLMDDLRFVRKTISRVKSDPVIMSNSKEQQKIFKKLAEREKDILKRLASIGHERSKMEIKRQMEMAKDKKALQKQLDVVRNSIAGVNSDHLMNSEEKQKKLEKLAGVEQYFLKRLSNY